ncbi:MAG: nucleotidyl transferase AbiEii/AbiGii toxin family protein, partial [Anaerolineales bacterium]|nr:nucleotidyl transferase AbiEii/AbiGii toxin family protein [Anaerolineales bacterium]
WFDTDQIQGDEIRAEDAYPGVRVRFMARLGNARIRMQLDIGFSDVITPADCTIEFPTLLSMPAPVLRGYPVEAVVAEKLQILVSRGELNSRIKDFFDLWQISRLFAFDGRVLQQAILATFAQRGTEVPGAIPTALMQEFARLKQGDWQRFLRPMQDTANIPTDFFLIITALQPFLLPVLQAASQDGPFTQLWPQVARGRKSKQPGGNHHHRAPWLFYGLIRAFFTSSERASRIPSTILLA